MDDSQPTRFSLLIRLKDRRDSRAWEEFADIYSPIVYGYLRRKVLQDADASDVTQEVFRTVSRSIGGFTCERQLGSFRGWLMSVVRSRMNDFLARTHRQVAGSGDTQMHRSLEEQPAEDSDLEAWNRDYQKSVFDWAAGRVRERFQEATWRAFWLTAIEGKDGKEVADTLGMTPGAVYVAKCRVLAQIRKRIQEVEQ